MPRIPQDEVLAQHEKLQGLFAEAAHTAERSWNQMLIALDKFKEAETQFIWTTEEYKQKHGGESVEMQMDLEKDPRYKQAIADCAYHRDRATMYGTAYQAAVTRGELMKDLTRGLEQGQIV